MYVCMYVHMYDVCVWIVCMSRTSIYYLFVTCYMLHVHVTCYRYILVHNIIHHFTIRNKIHVMYVYIQCTKMYRYPRHQCQYQHYLLHLSILISILATVPRTILLLLHTYMWHTCTFMCTTTYMYTTSFWISIFGLLLRTHFLVVVVVVQKVLLAHARDQDVANCWARQTKRGREIYICHVLVLGTIIWCGPVGPLGNIFWNTTDDCHPT